MGNFFQIQPALARFTLLNDNGMPQSGHYIEVYQWPISGNNTGRAVYVAASEEDEPLTFHLDTQRQVLRTYPTRAQDQQFDIAPVIEANANGEEVIELHMDLGDDTATFVLHPEDYEIVEEFSEDMLQVSVAEMRQVVY